jgi:hypothetical protein
LHAILRNKKRAPHSFLPNDIFSLSLWVSANIFEAFIAATDNYMVWLYPFFPLNYQKILKEEIIHTKRVVNEKGPIVKFMQKADTPLNLNVNTVAFGWPSLVSVIVDSRGNLTGSGQTALRSREEREKIMDI